MCMHEKWRSMPQIRERIGKKYDMMTWSWSCGGTNLNLSCDRHQVETDLTYECQGLDRQVKKTGSVDHHTEMAMWMEQGNHTEFAPDHQGLCVKAVSSLAESTKARILNG